MYTMRAHPLKQLLQQSIVALFSPIERQKTTNDLVECLTAMCSLTNNRSILAIDSVRIVGRYELLCLIERRIDSHR